MSREINSIASYIDNTLLSPTATLDDLEQFCLSSLKYDFGSVCIPPHFVNSAASILLESSINVCTVIGFPLGYNPKKIKAEELIDSMKNGAEELDIVINQSLLHSEHYQELLDEMTFLTNLVHQKYGIVKFIVETANLKAKQLDVILDMCLECKADYIKTSTGFASKGAELSTVKRWKKRIGEKNLKIKASGGIKNSKEAVSFISEGADRIGCSKGILIVEEYENK